MYGYKEGNMFDSSTILTTVRQAKRGDTDALLRGWRVFRTTHSGFIPSGIVATILAIVLLIFVSEVSKAVDGSYVNIGLILAIALLTGVLVGIIVWASNRNALLIITPDGFVQQTNARASIAVSYAELDYMDMRVTSGHNTWLWQHLPSLQLEETNVNAKSGSSSKANPIPGLKIQGEVTELGLSQGGQQRYTCATNVTIQDEVLTLKLTLRYLDGREVVWCPAKVFGSTLDIVPYINEGYVQYSRLKRRQVEQSTEEGVGVRGRV